MDVSDSALLKTKLSELFNNKDLQKLIGFSKDILGNIYPTKKRYSLSCRINLIMQKHADIIYYSIIVIVVLSIINLYVLYNFMQKRKARKIYQFLKQ